MISTAYSYYISQYGHKASTKYDTHTKSQLKDTTKRVRNVNSRTPVYRVDVSEKAQKYAIDLKEHAREITNIAKDLSDETSGDLTYRKNAESSNPEAVSVRYIGNSKEAAEEQSFDVEVSQIAEPQINTGNYLQPTGKALPNGAYTFDLNINNLTYEFEFNVSEDETNEDLQNKISRLINRSKVGLNSEVITDNLGNKAINIESDATGVPQASPYIFEITPQDNPVVSELGLNRTRQLPSNAIFELNGETKSSPSNEFVVNNNYNIKIKAPTQEPVKISLVDDDNSIIESIAELVSGYNSMMGVTNSAEGDEFKGNELLKREFMSIANKHRTTLSNNGLNINDDGTISLDEDAILEAAHSGNLDNVFKELGDFNKSIREKAEAVATDPMNYVNNKIVAYKDPKHPSMDPYNLSAYTGMMFNDYI